MTLGELHDSLAELTAAKEQLEYLDRRFGCEEPAWQAKNRYAERRAKAVARIEELRKKELQ